MSLNIPLTPGDHVHVRDGANGDFHDRGVVLAIALESQGQCPADDGPFVIIESRLDGSTTEYAAGAGAHFVHVT